MRMDRERRALWLSVVGALFFSLLGFAFFLPTDSEAILLDGFFSLIGFAMGLLSLRVARLVQSPDDRHFHFGYAAFEPMLNTIKGLIILAVCLFAFSSSVGSVLDGGRHINAGWGTVYAVVATAGCFTIALIQQRAAKKTGSQLVAVDVRTWLVDGFMSLVVTLAFVGAFLLSGSRWSHLVPYIDPGLVIVLTTFMFIVPIRIVVRGAGELLKIAPDASVQEEIRERVARVLDAEGLPDRVVRMVRIGREFWLLIHVLVPPDRSIGRISDLDTIRKRLHAEVAEVETGMVTDVVFTGDREWAG
jgi:cation diffusion facilitator family transporter